MDTDIEFKAILGRLQGNWTHAYGPAAGVSDLMNGIRKYDPDIIHFSGHGSSSERLVFLDENNQAKTVSRATLENLFATLKHKVRVVVLSACYSESQASAIGKSVDCVIGVKHTLKEPDAAKYAEQFYAALVAGRSVAVAHDEANIMLTDVDAEHKPNLLIKIGADAKAIVFKSGSSTSRRRSTVPPSTATEGSERQAAFRKLVTRYGISADTLSLIKIVDAEGKSVSRYEITNLRCRKGEISSLYWRFRSTSGLVIAPTLEPGATDAGIDWVTEKDPSAATFEDVLRNLGRLHGRFTFDPPITPGQSRSFAWTVSILNSDALTVWEFENLYPPEQRIHLNGKPLSGKPTEFCAQLVWFPVQKLQIGLRLPPSQMSRPTVKYFPLRSEPGKPCPVDQVFRGGLLFGYPEEGTAWSKANAVWNRSIDGLRSEVVSTAPDAPHELAVDFPTLGSFYSLDWSLPDPVLGPENAHLQAETEEIRARLLEHRRASLSAGGKLEPNSFSELFQKVHKVACDVTGAKDPTFATALMVWDRHERRMVSVEVCRNNRQIDPKEREFWLPFGLGLAGACFRTSPDAVRYKHDLDHGDPDRPDNYLPVPGRPHHAYLLSLAIDHPQWSETIRAEPHAQRCRQVVGVLSLGTFAPGSKLGLYCGDSLDEVMLRRLKESCQDAMNAISIKLLEDAGILDRSTGKEASWPEPSRANGLLRRPEEIWKLPAASEIYRFRVAAFDLDGTLLRGENFQFSWELVWERLGFAKTTQNQLRRKYRRQAAAASSPEVRAEAYREWCEEALKHFKSRGLTREKLREMAKAVALTNYCREALRELRAAGIVTVLISGGLNTFLEDVFPEFREYFDFVFVNELLFDPNDMLEGVNATAFDFEGKADALRFLSHQIGVQTEQIAFVGDHFNDERAMLLIGKSIAYPARDNVTKGVCDVEISEDNLIKVLPEILIPIS